jgi:hypothetical protein
VCVCVHICVVLPYAERTGSCGRGAVEIQSMPAREERGEEREERGVRVNMLDIHITITRNGYYVRYSYTMYGCYNI